MLNNTINNGGPAFPRPCSENRTQGDQPDGNSTVDEQEGMTLRDYFAAKAMQSMIVGPTIPNNLKRAGENLQDTVARMAYVAADAMLAARK